MSETNRPYHVETLLYLFGLLFVGIGIEHAIQDTSPLPIRAAELAVPVSLAASSMIATYWMAGRIERSQLKWVGYSTVGLGLLTGAVSVVASAIQILQGYTLNEPFYYGVVMAAGGAAAGPYLGYFYARLGQTNSELAHRNEEMEELNRRLAVANRVLRHNLRNNLAVIDGVATDFEDADQIDEMDQRIDLLAQSTDNLVNLSEKMNRIRKIWKTDERQEIDLVPVFEDVLSEIGAAYPATTLRVQLPDSAVVNAHPKIGSAFEELLVNAVEHNETSSLTIAVRVGSSDDGDAVSVTIADDGCGIPEIDQSTFAGTDPSETPLDHGIGLGLWLVHWAVEQSDGTFDVRNDDGAVVTMRLPRAGSVEAPSVRSPDSVLDPQPARYA